MLTTSFNNEIVTLDNAQFAIGIALSQLGERNAVIPVIEYLGSSVTGLQDYYDEDIASKREELRKQIAMQGCTVRALLNHLCEDVLLITDVSGHQKVKCFCGLKTLLTHSTLQEVYSQVMRILMHNSQYALILNFIDTTEYSVVFQKDLIRKYNRSADNIRGNDLNDRIINEIKYEFRDFVSKYSAESYEACTGTPIAYLRFVFNTYFPKDIIFSILNRSGQEAGVGSDDDKEYSALNFTGLDTDNVEKDIDFIDIANRINKASLLIFSHNSNSIAFYDIFSCYRDKVIASRYKELIGGISSILSGITIELVDSSREEGRGHEGAVKNKKSGRMKLCSDFETIITDGISRDEISNLYHKVIKTTETLSVKDGVRLFSTPSLRTKHVESNSEMMQIIVSGYIAVRELIEYLDRPDTISSFLSFPYRIFRNAEYLKRFQDIDEYVNYVNDVSDLVECAANDPAKKPEVIDGVYRNESIWGYLGASNLMSDSVFRKLASMPLTFIKSAVDDSRAVAKEELFGDAVRNVYRIVSSMYAPIVDTLGSNLEKVELATPVSLADMILAGDFSQKNLSVQYAISIAFVLSVKGWFEKIGKPVVDIDGNYLLNGSNSNDEFVDEIYKLNYENQTEKGQQTLKLLAAKKLKAFNKAYGVLTGIEVDMCSWQQVRETFFITDFLYMLLCKYYNRLDAMQTTARMEKSIYLLLADAATDLSLFTLPDHVVSTDSLAIVCSAAAPKYYINQRFDIKVSQDLNKERNSHLLLAINRWLSLLGEERVYLQFAPELLDKYVPKRFSKVTSNTVVDQILEKAAEDLRGFDSIASVPMAVKYKLAATFKFDNLGFAVINGERLCIDNTYIHRSGFAIIVDLFNKTFTKGVVTTEILQTAMSNVAFRSNV